MKQYLSSLFRRTAISTVSNLLLLAVLYGAVMAYSGNKVGWWVIGGAILARSLYQAAVAKK